MKIENQLIDNRENKCVDFAEQNTKPPGTALVQTPGKKFAEIQAQTMDTINLQHKKLIQRFIPNFLQYRAQTCTTF